MEPKVKTKPKMFLQFMFCGSVYQVPLVTWVSAVEQ